MGFFDIFKRKKVPDELPDLVSDELEKVVKSEALDFDKDKEELKRFLKSEGKEEKEEQEKKAEEKKASGEEGKIREDKEAGGEKKEKEEVKVEKEESKEKEKVAGDIWEKEKTEGKKEEIIINEDTERGFFKELQENILGEIKNLDKLDKWFNNKFLPDDIVMNMRSYWEKQKPDFLLNALERNFKGRIQEKLDKLQYLEKEWQDIYFDLLEKEEEIREEEKALKKILGEFVELCKRHLKKRESKR